MAARFAILLLALLAAPSCGSVLRRNASTSKRGCSLEGKGITADITTSPTSVPASGGEWTFKGAGKVKIANEACPSSGALPAADETVVNGGASDAKDVVCKGACCITYCCGSEDCFSTLVAQKERKAATAVNVRGAQTKGAKKAKLCYDAVSVTYNTPPSSEWTEMTTGSGECFKKAGVENIKICGFATLEATTEMDCGSGMKKVEMGSNKTMADCKTISSSDPYFNAFKYTCPY
jgi:hypothetical protein